MNVFFYSVSEAAERLGVHRRTLWLWIKHQRVPPPTEIEQSNFNVARYKSSFSDLWLRKVENLLMRPDERVSGLSRFKDPYIRFDKYGKEFRSDKR